MKRTRNAQETEGCSSKTKLEVTEGMRFWAPLLGWWNNVPPYATPYGSQIHRILVEGKVVSIDCQSNKIMLRFPVFGEDTVEKTDSYIHKNALIGPLPEGYTQLSAEMIQKYEHDAPPPAVPAARWPGAGTPPAEALARLGWDPRPAAAAAPAAPAAPAAAAAGSAAAAGGGSAEEEETKAPLPRLEVLWDVQNDEGVCQKEWFACTLEGLVEEEEEEEEGAEGQSGSGGGGGGGHDAELARFTWLLRYDARGEAFPEVRHRCRLLDRASLRDLETAEGEDGGGGGGGAELTWKWEGQEVDRAAMQASLSKMVLSMVQVLGSQAEIESEEGEQLEQYAAQELEKFPFYAQQIMAGIYRNFADRLKAGLRKRMQELISEGKDTVITPRDIGIIMADIKSSQPMQIPDYL